MAKTGRPTKFTPEMEDEICAAIGSSHKGLNQLCAENPHWPDRSNIFRRMNDNLIFRDKYTKAKEAQVEVSVDYLQEMMNENHYYIDDKGQQRIDTGMVRIKTDTIKWKASKLKPKKYTGCFERDIDDKREEEIKERYREIDEQNKKDF